MRNFNNILDNALNLVSPWTGNMAAGAFRLTGLGLGTVGDPALQFTSDTNTGLYSTAADTVDLATGGVRAASFGASWLLSAAPEDARTNTVDVVGEIRSTTSGIPAANIGVGVLFSAESADENPADFGRLDFVATDVTAASEDTVLDILLRTAGAALGGRYRFQATGAFLATITHALTAARTITLQDADHTLVGRDTTDTLTNKTLGATTLAGTLSRAADQIIDLTGAATRTLTIDNSTTGQVCNLDVDGNLIFRSGTAFTVALDHVATANRSHVIPDTADDTFAMLAATQTLTNKTLSGTFAGTPTWSGAHTFSANPKVSNAAPIFQLEDTTALAKSLTITVDANVANLRESAGLSGSLLALDLANNQVGIGTASPTSVNALGRFLEIATGANTQTGLVLSSAPTSGSGNGGILEIRASNAPGGDDRIGQLDWARETDITAGQLSTSATLWVNNDGTMLRGISITRTGAVGLGNLSTASEILHVNGRIRMNTWTADGDTAVYKDDPTGNIGVITSDRRLKKNLTVVTSALQTISMVPAYCYNKLSQPDGSKRRLGLMAQDLLPLMPEVVYERRYEDKDEVYYGVHYDQCTVLLWAGLQEIVQRLMRLEENDGLRA